MHCGVKTDGTKVFIQIYPVLKRNIATMRMYLHAQTDKHQSYALTLSKRSADYTHQV